MENLYDSTILLFYYWVLKGIKLRFFVFGWTMSGHEWIVGWNLIGIFLTKNIKIQILVYIANVECKLKLTNHNYYCIL